MILKIADYSRVDKKYKQILVHNKGTKTNTQRDDTSWWFFDNIARAKVTHYVNNAAAHIAYPNPDVLFTNIHFNSKCECDGVVTEDGMTTGCSECVTTAVISCRLENGNEVIIMLDTVAYLLNDNGKTIEKIVANYL